VTSSSVLLFAMREGAGRRFIAESAGWSGTAADFVIGGEPGAEKLSSVELLDRSRRLRKISVPMCYCAQWCRIIFCLRLLTRGAAEAAYFAQAGAVYEMILGRVTPIVPRFSATLVELKFSAGCRSTTSPCQIHSKGPRLLGRSWPRVLSAGLQDAFERANKSVEESFSGLKKALAKLDPTLVEACQTGASKVHYQLDRLHERGLAAEFTAQ